jgi:putative nucleotidyltransferase with HDIG domain
MGAGSLPVSPSLPPGWRPRAVPLRLLLLALLAGLSVGAAWLLDPPGMERFPGPEALGAPVPATVRAHHDVDIIDEEATARRRAEAAQQERPVYDHDEAAPDEAAARIHAAFSLMREEEAALLQQQAAAGLGELLPRFTAQRDAFVARLQLLVRDPDFAALAAARFSAGAERELAGLARKGLGGLVVQDPALLPDDREAGFLVRTVRSGRLTGEGMLTDLALVRTEAAARQEVAAAARARLAGVPPPLRAALLHLAAESVHPTLVYNQAETQRRRTEAAARVKPVGVTVRRGERVVAEGERLQPEHLAVFQALRAAQAGRDRGQIRLAGALAVALLLAVAWRLAVVERPGSRRPAGARDALLAAALLAGIMLAGLGVTALSDLLQDQLPGLSRAPLLYLVPAAAAAVLARELLGGSVAILLTLVASLILGLTAGTSVPLALHAVVTSLAAVGFGGRQRKGWLFLRRAAATGLSGVVVAVAMALLAGWRTPELLLSAGAALLSGAVLVPVLVAAALPPLARLLGDVTDGQLLALANLNHPALKELIVQAPGTYRHSIVVGALVEEAARAIGADPLLARVGAYYHDIGKIHAPLLFAENQRDQNAHDDLAPPLSAIAIRHHITDGLEAAGRWRLPTEVCAFIEQHHGTRRMAYFWARQQRLAEAGGAEPDEATFRYRGPRPQTREVALVMLADACEASAHLAEAPSPGGLRALVDQRFAEIRAEGQLDECELTQRDLALAAEAMARALQPHLQARPDRPARSAVDHPGAIHLVRSP